MSAEVNLKGLVKVPYISSTEDCSQHCFKTEWTLIPGEKKTKCLQPPE